MSIGENMFTSAALSVWPIFSVASGKTVTTAEGLRVDSGGSGGAGTITTAIGLHVVFPQWTAATKYAAVFDGDVRINGAGSITSGTWSSTSDPRIKINMKPVNETAALETITSLQIYTWQFDPAIFINRTVDTRTYTGFLASNVTNAYPDAVVSLGNISRTDGSEVPNVMGIIQDDLQNLAVAGLRQLKREVDALKAEVAALRVLCNVSTTTVN
jgi:hypothetical protein